MGTCDKCGYDTPKDYDYYKSDCGDVCLCADCYGDVDLELMGLFGIEFRCITAGYDDVGTDEYKI